MSSSIVPSYFLRRGFSLNPKISILARLVGQLIPGIHLSLFPIAGLTGSHGHGQSSCVVDSNSGPLACTTLLLTQSLPCP